MIKPNEKTPTKSVCSKYSNFKEGVGHEETLDYEDYLQFQEIKEELFSGEQAKQ